MAIDSLQLLTDCASQLWQRLDRYGAIEALPASENFDNWISGMFTEMGLDLIEEQTIRRDYRRLRSLLAEIETLVCSQHRAIDMVRTRATEVASQSQGVV